MPARNNMGSPEATPQSARHRRALRGSLAISLITIAAFLVVWGSRRSTPLVFPPASPSSSAVELKPQNEPKSRGARRAPAELGVALIQPKPNARYKLGESIPVEGYLEVPAGASLFEREVYLANSIILPRVGRALDSGRLVPCEEIDGRLHFRATIDPPKRPGTYETHIEPPRIVSDDDESFGNDSAEPALITKKRFATRGPRFPTVRYQVVKEKP